MNLDLPLFVLLVIALVFSIIELGLSADIVNAIGPDGQYFPATDVFDYLVFCSVWSMLISGFLIVWAYLARGKSQAGRNDGERWLAPLTLGLNFITMIFWLAGFATLADRYNGYNPRDVLGAQLAFAVMLWLIYLALLVLNVMTAFGYSHSSRAGHSRLFSKVRVDGAGAHTHKTTTTTDTAV